MDSRLRQALLEKADLDKLEEILKSKGHTNMFSDGRRLVSEGITAAEELNKIFGIHSED